MKRILAIMLCTVLLCGCTAQIPQTEPAKPAGQQPEAEPAEQTDAPAEPTAQEPAAAPAQTGAVTPLTIGESVSIALNGTAAQLVLTETLEGEYETPVLRAAVDGTETVLADEYGWMPGAWLYTPAEGGPLLVVTVDLASDDYDTMVFTLSGKQMQKTTELYGAVTGIETDGTAHLSFHIDVLGTWNGLRDYVVSAEGLTPVAGSDFAIHCEQPIVTSAKVPVELLQDGQYTPGALEAGTEVYLTSTDNESYVNFRLAQDGTQELRLSFTRQDYQIYIDGRPEDQFFRELFYAG